MAAGVGCMRDQSLNDQRRNKSSLLSRPAGLVARPEYPTTTTHNMHAYAYPLRCAGAGPLGRYTPTRNIPSEASGGHSAPAAEPEPRLCQPD